MKANQRCPPWKGGCRWDAEQAWVGQPSILAREGQDLVMCGLANAATVGCTQAAVAKPRQDVGFLLGFRDYFVLMLEDE